MATSPAQGTTPKLEDFPDAEIIGGAVILDGKNMGTLMVTGEVEPSAAGTAYLAEPPEAEAMQPRAITEVPDPVPPGVIDPKEHEKVKAVAKREVRRRKQNEAVIDAMNSPNDEEEAAMQAADEAMAAGEAPPPAGRDAQGKRTDGLEPGTAPVGNPGGDSQSATSHQPSPASGATQQPPAAY